MAVTARLTATSTQRSPSAPAPPTPPPLPVSALGAVPAPAPTVDPADRRTDVADAITPTPSPHLRQQVPIDGGDGCSHRDYDDYGNCGDHSDGADGGACTQPEDGTETERGCESPAGRWRGECAAPDAAAVNIMDNVIAGVLDAGDGSEPWPRAARENVPTGHDERGIGSHSEKERKHDIGMDDCHEMHDEGSRPAKRARTEADGADQPAAPRQEPAADDGGEYRGHCTTQGSPACGQGGDVAGGDVLAARNSDRGSGVHGAGESVNGDPPRYIAHARLFGPSDDWTTWIECELVNRVASYKRCKAASTVASGTHARWEPPSPSNATLLLGGAAVTRPGEGCCASEQEAAAMALAGLIAECLDHVQEAVRADVVQTGLARLAQDTSNDTTNAVPVGGTTEAPAADLAPYCQRQIARLFQRCMEAAALLDDPMIGFAALSVLRAPIVAECGRIAGVAFPWRDRP
nr:hypothetical protein [Pandoravirus belohorizontensis]